MNFQRFALALTAAACMAGIPAFAQTGTLDQPATTNETGTIEQTGTATDPGVNQSGSMDQTGASRSDVTQSGAMSQPGTATGNQSGTMSQPGMANQPGVNQPGTMNQPGVATQPGVNQPGTMNQPGVATQPGVNQPGATNQPGEFNQPGAFNETGRMNQGFGTYPRRASRYGREGWNSSANYGRRGSHSAAIRRVQRQLRAEGLYRGRIDGIAGPQFHAAVRRFQRSENLRATGRLDSATLRRLGVGGGIGSAGRAAGYRSHCIGSASRVHGHANRNWNRYR